MTNVKKTVFTIAALFFLLFSFISCEDAKKEHKKEDVPKVMAPAQIVTVKEAKTMYNTYGKRIKPLIQRYEDSINYREYYDKLKKTKKKIRATENADDVDKPKKFDVARYVYYDYATIKQYMAYIEQEAAAANVEISTLRLYFSNYPNKKYFPGTKDSVIHPRQNSVMLSPTLKKGDRDYLFHIAVGEKERQAVILSDAFEKIEEQGMGTISAEENKSYASFVPSWMRPNSTTAPFLYQNEQSLTLNRGTGVPPPHQ